MPSPAPKSDLIRYALLYHHGGLYMDADFVAVKDMDPIVALLETHDFISYQEKGPRKLATPFVSSELSTIRRRGGTGMQCSIQLQLDWWQDWGDMPGGELGILLWLSTDQILRLCISKYI